jgi:putative tricarboxylic transport membrane protein
LPSLIEFWRLKFVVVRSLLIGLFAGVLPGIGATLASFLSYNEAVRWSKHPEKFGKGILEGVVAPETANNSATGAAMIPLLALGLPGGALTAMMLGVFQIHGLEPGPLIFITSLDLVWVVFAAMFLANVCIFFVGYIETKTVVHLLKIPFQFLAPAILMLATIGAYSVRNLIMDVWIMFAAAILGFFLKRHGFSAAGVVLGLVLGSLGESSFVKSMQLMQYDWLGFFERPIAGTLILAALLTIFMSFYKAIKQELK